MQKRNKISNFLNWI